MEKGGQEPPLVDGSHQRQLINKSETPRTALVLYGSETGNAQDVAEEVGQLIERLRFNTSVLDLDSIQLRDLVKPTIVIFAVSTTGQGDFPQNARKFWKALLSSALKPGLLRKVRFASFGLGDSSYPQYNVVHRLLHGRLLHLGAKSFCDRGEGNEQHPEGHSAGLREWIVALKASLFASFPLPPDEPPIPDDAFLEPKWKLELSGSLPHGDNGCADTDKVVSKLPGKPDKQLNRNAMDAPSTHLLPVRASHTALIVRNERVTAPDHFQDVRLLELRAAGTYEYRPGAVATIFPKNFPNDVQAFIDLMQWESVADIPINIIPSYRSTASVLGSPSPLRHLDLATVRLTMRWLLENVLDIMSIPRRSFFASLAHFAGTATEDERYQKERLLELANPELIDELWDYTTRPKRTIIEVMSDFTTIRIPWQYALTVLPIMKGRQFSIASGGPLRYDHSGNTRVELLIAIADPPSPIIKYKRRYGVCTRYVTALQGGQHMNIGLQPGYLDVQPSEVDVPVLMVGPGTGVAPMRSMIYQRLAWVTDNGERPAGKRLESDMLIFGCRCDNSDHFFRDEWQRLADTEGLTVRTAFSRDKLHPKQYVQDKIREEGPRIRQMLMELDGKVYVCGSSGNMPKGVREALTDVLAEHSDMGEEEAVAYLERLEKAGRYKQETW
ncbi:hypothetical protein BAUCODRAFT_31441 [Baudoinia panamericana UAMH 10762]|uniref:NADPH-dependent diflavin oxidoreductase 1 n=1 Tax=Baudoinia panamericana (strain UAMH 10762) TaxID=717646 RepID=M2N547_BAUPA|nr:uncharacterized protein BAUCODRAFT_31441 [Baudoinia panamericana UAMH 10762]EMC99133.1 hypothetical protein BAUCODRAFT_31441 [Baudoinia panamericana UAMH 10762]